MHRDNAAIVVATSSLRSLGCHRDGQCDTEMLTGRTRALTEKSLRECASGNPSDSESTSIIQSCHWQSRSRWPARARAGNKRD